MACILSKTAMSIASPSSNRNSWPQIQSVQWKRLSSISESKNFPLPTPPRSGHVSFVSSNDPENSKTRSLYIFGGYAEEQMGDTIKRYTTNDLWKVDFDFESINHSSDEIFKKINGWQSVVQEGIIPSKRLVSAIAVLSGSAYLFGGWDPEDPETVGSIFLDTVHSYHPKTNSWSPIPTQIPDGGTSRHVVVALPSPGQALLHNHRCQNFIYLFNANSQSFVKQPTKNNQNAPSNRGLHAACLLDKVHVLFFGGAAQDGTMSNESFLLNIATWEWTRLKIKKNIQDNQMINPEKTVTMEIPCERASPCLVKLQDNCAVLFGGAARGSNGLEPLNDLWILYVDAVTGTGQWERLKPEGTNDMLPPARNAATLNEIYSHCTNGQGQIEQYFILQGGWAPFRRTWADTYVLVLTSVP